MISEPRILVIDDEEIIRSLCEKILTDNGCDVTLAEDGNRGVESYRGALDSDHAFDAVILDLTLTEEMSGQDTLRHLKEIDPEAKVIVCSGDSSNPTLLYWRKYGFAGAIVKPFRADSLISEIRKVVGLTG
jgi:DNA-binding NtrC family response regulator